MMMRGSYGVMGIAATMLLAGTGCQQKGGSAGGGVTTKPASVAVAPATKPSPYAWRSIFDGKTMSNWKATDFGGEGTAAVKNGAIMLPPGNPMTGVTWSGGEIPKMNYEIALEAQRVDGSDFFCALTFPVNDESASLILGGWGGNLCGISSLDGFDAANNETTKMKNFEQKKWYAVRVRVFPERLQAWLDDEQIVNVSTKGRKVGVRIEVEACKPLGIASYQTTGAIRDIRVRNLRPEEVEEAARINEEQ